MFPMYPGCPLSKYNVNVKIIYNISPHVYKTQALSSGIAKTKGNFVVKNNYDTMAKTTFSYK